MNPYATPVETPERPQQAGAHYAWRYAACLLFGICVTFALAWWQAEKDAENSAFEAQILKLQLEYACEKLSDES